MRLVFDAELNGLDNPDKLWCVVTKDIDTDEVRTFRFDREGDWVSLTRHLTRAELLIGCNIIGYDCRHLSRLVPELTFNFDSLLDLQIVSRLVWYNRPGGHSVEAFGNRYGHPKPVVVDYDDAGLIDLYVHRCTEDVHIQHKMFTELERFITDPDWQDSIKIEHQSQEICEQMKERGFYFDVKGAEELLEQITEEMAILESSFKDIPPRIVPAKKPTILRKKPDGVPWVRTQEVVGDSSFVDGGEFFRVDYREFNPGSHKDRIDFLWSAGWSPTEKSKGHKDFLKQRGKRDPVRVSYYLRYGWKVNEENLDTLPPDAPDAAKKLAEWLTLEGRRGDLEEWLNSVRPDTGCIHGNTLHIGAWTQRKSHSNPNRANIFGNFYISNCKDEENPTPVESVKLKYNNVLRARWQARPDCLLVGTDAEGIQLRILAHVMGDEDYAEAVANGRKEDETDVHNVNRRALGLNHIVRDDAKTFIYAWLLGASAGKVKEILRCELNQARAAVATFLDRLPALGRLKQEEIPRLARQRYFVGLDGRKVFCDSEHLMLAGILQAGESVVMKHANVLWRQWADEEHIPYWQVNDVHDEWQTEVRIVSPLLVGEGNDGRPYTIESERLGELQRASIEEAGRRLGVLTPLAGKTNIGVNWYETH